MWYPAELVLENYIPDQIEKGMLFINILNPGTFKETYEVFSLERVPRDESAFTALNGFPVKLLILIDDDEDSIKHEQIGWFDFGEEVDFLTEISLKEINIILNEFNGWLEIEIDDEAYEEYDLVIPIIQEEKASIRFYIEEEEYINE